MKHQDKMKELNRTNKAALGEVLLEKKERIRQLRFDLSAGKVKNVREVRGTRRDIARLNTLLKLKQNI